MVWSHVCSSNWVRDRTALAAFPSTLRQWIRGKAVLWQENVPSSGTLEGHGSKQSSPSFSSQQCAVEPLWNTKHWWKNSTNTKKTPKNKTTYNIMVLMAFKSLQFFPLWLPPMGRYLKWCCEGMWLNIKCHGNGHWFGFGEKFHIIFFIIRCVTSLVLTSGIILAYSLKTFHRMWVVSL